MSNAVPAQSDPRIVYRKAVVYCVLPADLANLRDVIDHHLLGTDVEVVVERRSGDERRTGFGPDPATEQRTADRRCTAAVPTAAAVGLDLPWQAWRHADRIHCVQRMVPVHRRDALDEARTLLTAATDGDRASREELRLRYGHQVHTQVRASVPRRHAPQAADRVFAQLFDRANTGAFDDELASALRHVLEPAA